MRSSRRRHPVIAAAAVLALMVATVTPAVAAEPPSRDSWIVTLVEGADPAREAPALAQTAGGQAGLVYTHALRGFQLIGSAQAAAALERHPRVASVQADGPLHLTETLPFGIERVAAYGLGGNIGAYQEGFRGNGARIAVLDTGIDLDHPDLVASIDGSLGRNCVDTTLPPNDGYGHGTHVAGTAAAPVNGTGVVGVAPESRLVAVKMFDDAGGSSEARALCALDHIIGLNSDADAANDIHVANMSWGESRAWGDCASDALHGAICRAHAAGLILVAGAGNSGVDASSFVPAAYPEVISVSALADFDGERGGLAGCGFVWELFANECDDSLAFFSNHGPSVDVIAPGVQVYSTWAGGGWQTSSGTSMAAPHVSGIAALMAAAAPGLAVDVARAALLSSGECPNGEAADVDGIAGCGGQGLWPDDPDGVAEPMGHALRAARAVSGGSPPPPPPPDPVPPSAPVLSGVASDSSVSLSWTTPTDDGGASITGYEIYRDSALLATVGVENAYTDTSVENGTTYSYAVAAVNSAGVGTLSNEVSATPAGVGDVPSAPLNLKAKAQRSSVNLSWAAPASDGGSSVTAYRVYRGLSSGERVLVAEVAGRSYSDASVSPRTHYFYVVTAVNTVGEGPPSNEVRIRSR